MKIHSNILTASNVYLATYAGGMVGVNAEVETKGSRSRKRRLDVRLTGTSNRRPNGGTYGANSDEYAATWDEWGMFISALFEIDPEAIIGQYPDRETFHAVTFDRFKSLTAPYQHKNHNWDYDQSEKRQKCKGCEAQFDWNALHEKMKEDKAAKV